MLTERVGATEPILELLEAMRDRTPSLDHPSSAVPTLSVLVLLRMHAEQEEAADTAEDDRSPTRRWAPQTRVRVRARNVLRRWAAAQNDPRLLWIDPLAPAGNFSAVATTFARLWLAVAKDPGRCELHADDLDDLWLNWMQPFVGTGRGDGWLDQLDATDVGVIDRLPTDLPETIAALCWLALRNRDRDARIAWQPVLNAGLRHGLLEPTDETARFVSLVTHTTVSRSTLEEDLLRCIEFIDDELWCEKERIELALESLRLDTGSPGQSVAVRLLIKGVVEPLRDPRIPRLIVAARRYRRCDGLAIFSEDEPWRLVIDRGLPVAYMSGTGERTMVDSEEVLTDSIDQMAAMGGILADLFVRSQVA